MIFARKFKKFSTLLFLQNGNVEGKRSRFMEFQEKYTIKQLG